MRKWPRTLADPQHPTSLHVVIPAQTLTDLAAELDKRAEVENNDADNPDEGERGRLIAAMRADVLRETAQLLRTRVSDGE